VDWRSLARPGQTLAFYMGVAELDVVRERLIEAGLPAATPAALIENGSRPAQRVLVTELAALAAAARIHAMTTPALLFVGEVAGLAPQLAWFGREPLVDACRAAQVSVYGMS
jgi:uroporphyrin-III C-methyltransferase/precorrin-2 dehydrogenase/sirohydrochlorin ferrochelatase